MACQILYKEIISKAEIKLIIQKEIFLTQTCSSVYSLIPVILLQFEVQMCCS